MTDAGDTLRELVDERAPGLAATRTLSERYGQAQGLLAQLPDVKDKVADQIRAYDACALWTERAPAVSALQAGHQALVGAHAGFHEAVVTAYNALQDAEAGGATLDAAGVKAARDAEAALEAAITAFGGALTTLGSAIQTASEAFVAWARVTAETNLEKAFISEHPDLADALHVTSMSVALAAVMFGAAAIAFPPLAIVAAALPLIAKAATEGIKAFTIDRDLEDPEILRRFGPGHGTAKKDEEEGEYGETLEKVQEGADKLQEQFERVTQVVGSSGLEHAAHTMEAVGHGTGGVLSGTGMVVSQYAYGEAVANPTVVTTTGSVTDVAGYEAALSEAFRLNTLAVRPEVHGQDGDGYIVSVGDTTYILAPDGVLWTFDQWRAAQNPPVVEPEAPVEPEPPVATYEVPDGAPSHEEWQAAQEERPEREYEDNRW